MLGQALGLTDAELESAEYNRRQHGAVGVTRHALEDYACVVCNRQGAGH